METKRQLYVEISDPDEKFTKQIKVSMPQNYIKEIDRIANEMHVPKRLIIWDAVSHYIRVCRKGADK
jgi:metal-responsive CopG/Arc/MetJ family transcriptional regulator